MNRKPILYEAACIFSIAGSSIGFFSMLLSVIFYRAVVDKIISFTNITATEKLSPLYFAFLMAAFCISFAGAVKLYRLQRSGIYFYLTAQILIGALPVVWIGNSAFSETNAIFTLVFSGVYLSYIRITS